MLNGSCLGIGSSVQMGNVLNCWKNNPNPHVSIKMSCFNKTLIRSVELPELKLIQLQRSVLLEKNRSGGRWPL